MKQKFETLEQANIFIDKVNILLGLPNEVNGTLTYSIPELVEIKENDVVVETYYEVPITSELSDILIGIATKQLVQHEEKEAFEYE